MQFNRTKATEVILKTAQLGKALEFYGQAITGVGKVLNKLCSNKDFQVEAVNSAEFIHRTIVNQVRGLTDRYRDVVEEDAIELFQNVSLYQENINKIQEIKIEENKNNKKDNVFDFRSQPLREC